MEERIYIVNAEIKEDYNLIVKFGSKSSVFLDNFGLNNNKTYVKK